MANDPSKTEAATPKRLKEARKKGNVAKSQDVTKTVSLLAGLMVLTFWLGYIGREMMGLFRHFLGKSTEFVVTDANLTRLGLDLAGSLAKMLLPILLFIMVASYAVLRVQVGKLWTTEVFQFKLSKFNPISGLQRMFLSMQTFVRLGKSLLQALFIGLAPALVIKKEWPNFPLLYHMSPEGVTLYILDVGSRIVVYALASMVAIAVFDFWYTRKEYADNLKMTKDEVKDERKQMDGDPVVKGQMRQKMMKMAMRRMMQDVPKADVVVTNPTHIAVALRYDADEAPAPVIVAMGADIVAMKIKDIAREHKVPIRENKPLAWALYKQAEVGDVIPPELFQAVAAVLAQIWKMRPPAKKK